MKMRIPIEANRVIKRPEFWIHYSVFRCILRDRGRVELIAALTEIIKHDEDRIMIVDLGTEDVRADERIEFPGMHPTHTESKAVVA